MTKKLELYKCGVCGNIVQVLVSGMGDVVCCGENMKLLTPKTLEEDEIMEKHSPKIEIHEDETVVTLRNHPMTEEHHVMFMENISENQDEVKIKFFEPSQDAILTSDIKDKNQSALEYCNIHGLFESKK